MEEGQGDQIEGEASVVPVVVRAQLRVYLSQPAVYLHATGVAAYHRTGLVCCFHICGCLYI